MTEDGNKSGAASNGPGRVQPSEGATGDIRRFYDSLAPDYDLMTSFDDRFAKERPWFEAIVAGYGIRSALDAGCGTGFHSILLSRLGVTVAGVDASPAMIERARENARRFGAAVILHTGEFSGISTLAAGPFDAVFCLGNSLPHLLTDAALAGALSEFRNVLSPGGVLIIQMLNYEKILSEKKEVLGKREAGGISFERTYQYGDDAIMFTISRSAGENPPQMDVVRLRPLNHDEVAEQLGKTGFGSIAFYGKLDLAPFSQKNSPDLVVIARVGQPAG